MFPTLLYASASDSSSLEFMRYINSVIIIIIIIIIIKVESTDELSIDTVICDLGWPILNCPTSWSQVFVSNVSNVVNVRPVLDPFTGLNA